MTTRTKGEQKAYLDGYEMCAECIEKYLSAEGKKKLECLLAAVRNAVAIEDLESEDRPKGEWIRNGSGYDYAVTSKYDFCTCGADMRGKAE